MHSTTHTLITVTSSQHIFQHTSQRNFYYSSTVPRFPGDEGQGLVGVGPLGVRMMWSTDIHTAKLHSLSLLESQTQTQAQAHSTEVNVTSQSITFHFSWLRFIISTGI